MSKQNLPRDHAEDRCPSGAVFAKDQGLSIMVSGKLDAVMKARKDIVARLQTQASATVAIPKEHHRFVIGKNGEKLQDLELKTATKIQIPRPDDASNQIRITGTKEGIEKARHEVLLISAEQDKRAVERLEVEKAFHPSSPGLITDWLARSCRRQGRASTSPAQRQPDRNRLHWREGAVGSGCGSHQEDL